MTGLAQIPIEQLHPNPKNRRDLGDLTELTESIRTQGIWQPLVVEQERGGWLIVDGHRRYTAARAAGATALPCIVTRPGDDSRRDTIMLATAMHKEFSPLDQARVFKRLRARGMTVTEISKRTGYTARTVGARLALLALPAEAQQMVEDGELTVTAATDLGRQVSAEGRGETRTPVTNRPAWFTTQHRLAATVSAACTHYQSRRRIGPACGQCWEDTIRADERQKAGA